MGDRYRLKAGDRMLAWGKNDLPLHYLTVFREGDRKVNRSWVDALASLAGLFDAEVEALSDGTALRDQYFDRNGELNDILLAEGGQFGPNQTYVDSPFAYATTAGVIRERLDLAGFTFASCRREFVALIRMLNDDSDDVEITQPGRASVSRIFTPDQVLDIGLMALEELREDGVRSSDVDWWRLECLHQLEPWIYSDENVLPALALQLEKADSRTVVELDLHELLLAQYFAPEENLTGRAWERLADLTAGNGPIIVVTEGKSDARYVSMALALVYPHLSDYFRFLDFDTKHEGGTDQVVRTLRSLAAVGVMNRVIGVLDNDGAGAKAVGDLKRSKLPDTVRYFTLPKVPYGNDYPTGPDTFEDINGRAVSIEFMFGPAALTAADGSLVPVTWSTQVGRSSDQGSLSNKRLVQRNIDELLKRPASELRGLHPVWDAISALASSLLSAAAPSRFPGQELT